MFLLGSQLGLPATLYSSIVLDISHPIWIYIKNSSRSGFTTEGRALLQQSGAMLLKTGQNWGAMRSIIIELVDPNNIPTMFTHMTTGQLAFLRGILESKRDKIPRKEIQFMLKEYALNLERQLDWTKRMLKKS